MLFNTIKLYSSNTGVLLKTVNSKVEKLHQQTLKAIYDPDVL